MTPASGHCRDCRYWNGGGERPSPCFKIKGQAGEWFTIPIGRAAFHAPDGTPPAYLMTGPNFGCTLFEEGRPRFWGDDGD
jgi:hypothetical protein